MTLREIINSFQEFAEANPEALDMKVVTCNGNECNGYRTLYLGLDKGFYHEDAQRFLTDSDEQYDKEEYDELKEESINAVTID